MTYKQAQKSTKREYSLFLEKKLITEFDKTIFPYKRSNVVHELISNYLDKKNQEEKIPLALDPYQSRKEANR